jgi:hypothetical protein
MNPNDVLRELMNRVRLTQLDPLEVVALIVILAAAAERVEARNAPPAPVLELVRR